MDKVNPTSSVSSRTFAGQALFGVPGAALLLTATAATAVALTSRDQFAWAVAAVLALVGGALLWVARKAHIRLSSVLCVVVICWSLLFTLVESPEFPWRAFAVWLAVDVIAIVSTVANLARFRSRQFAAELLLEVAALFPYQHFIASLLRRAG